MSTATRLDNLSVEEISGVDAPANQTPGWMVLKSADDAVQAESSLAALYATLGGATLLDNEAVPENVRKAREELEQFLEGVLVEPTRPKESLMTKMARLFRTERPAPETEEPVVEKTETEPVVEKTETEPAAEEPTVEKTETKEPEAAPVEKAETEPVFKAEDVETLRAVAETAEVLKEALGALFDRLENVEKALTGSAQLDDQLDPVTKGAPTLRDGIVSAAMGNRVTIY